MIPEISKSCESTGAQRALVHGIVDNWRSTTLNKMLLVGVIIVLPAAIQTALRAYRFPNERLGAVMILTAYLAVVALAFMRTLNPCVRGWGVVALLFGVSVLAMMRGGLAGDGRVYFMAIPVMGLALLGIRPGLILAGLIVVTYAVFAVLAHAGLLSQWLILHDNSVSLEMWVYDGIVLLTLLCSVMVVLIDQSRFLMKTLRAEQQKARDLSGANAQVNEAKALLEQKVEERTSELAEANRVLQHLASHDALTGLPNRTLFIEKLEHAISLARRHKQIVAVAYLDLDDFKQVNDNYGHAQGDVFLQKVAQRISDCVRSCDTCARLAGDEFALILENLDSVDSAANVAEKLLDSVGNAVLVRGGTASVSVSIGISVFPESGDGPEELLHNADSAMYQVKASTKNSYRFFSA